VYEFNVFERSLFSMIDETVLPCHRRNVK